MQRRNVLLITVDQWRGDGLSAVGHSVLRTPSLDRLASKGTLFRNHWANAAPCGPSRACLYTGTYLHHHRSVLNGTPLADRFTNIARVVRSHGLDPVLFGYTDTSIDPSTVEPSDPRLRSYEGVLPGFRPIVHDPYEAGSVLWARWLERHGVDVPTSAHELYLPKQGVRDADRHGWTWAPTRFRAEHSETAFMVGEIEHWLDNHSEDDFFIHASFIRPHPPRRNPEGYHDLYDADQVETFIGARSSEEEAKLHPFNEAVMALRQVTAPTEEIERRQLRATYYGAQREVDDQLGRLFRYLERTGLAASTLVIVTSDHGDMAGDHWLVEKLGYWDESFHIPLIIVDPYAEIVSNEVSVPTESVDILPTICEWLGIETPLQVDGASLLPFLHGGPTPEHWRTEAHFEWDFRSPTTQMAERWFGIPMDHCSLAVVRGDRYKYVQFAADEAILPPLLFDLERDPDQVHNLLVEEPAVALEPALRASQDLLQWRMRTDERLLTGSFLSSQDGLVVTRDAWR
ncbi:MAG: sulfatase-like hydrolase/transferase [Acidimicrobiales bacterium]